MKWSGSHEKNFIYHQNRETSEDVFVVELSVDPLLRRLLPLPVDLVEGAFLCPLRWWSLSLSEGVESGGGGGSGEVAASSGDLERPGVD